MFQRNISPPSSRSKNKPNKIPAWKVANRALLHSSKTSVHFQWTTQRYIPADSTLLLEIEDIVTDLLKALRNSGHVVAQQDDATVLWKSFLRVGACTCDVMLDGACAGDVCSDCATVGDRFPLGSGQQTNEMPGGWWRGTWRDNRTAVASGVFGESAQSARRLYQSTDQAEAVSVQIVRSLCGSQYSSGSTVEKHSVTAGMNRSESSQCGNWCGSQSVCAVVRRKY
jgi:hypothetical protein